MIPFAVVALQVAACLGAGATVLRIFGLTHDLCVGDRLTWSFAIGFGIIGWALFFVGIAGGFSVVPLLMLLALASIGCVILFPLGLTLSRPQGLVGWTLTATLVVILTADFIEGLAPPADADSLAYHFALPKQFLEAGRLVFVHRVADGAIPLLVHMTYVPVLGLGGERALTLWTMVSGWATAALLYAGARRFLDSRWSLAITLVFMTTPAVLYSAGAGHVEIRNGLFVLLAAICIADGLCNDRPSSFLLAGIAAGFFAGSKYFGLLFLIAAGLCTLIRGRWFRQATLFSGAAIVAGFQWYFWNWLHTGDPIFPVLISKFGIGDEAFWSPEFSQWFIQGFYEPESAVPANLLWLLLYPIKATFNGAPVFDSGRTGLGMFVALLSPIALAAAWRFRSRIAGSSLIPFAVIPVAFYILWFLFGSTQRVRHLLPFYPLALIAISAATLRLARDLRASMLVAAAVAVTVSIQLLGLAVYTKNYVRYLVDGESRDAFLARNVQNYLAVDWVNNALTQKDRVFTTYRHTIYLFRVPVYYGHIFQDPRVELRPSTSPELLVRQLRSQGVTHIFVGENVEPFALITACLDEVRRFNQDAIGSRTLGSSGGVSTSVLFRLTENCPYG